MSFNALARGNPCKYVGEFYIAKRVIAVLVLLYSCLCTVTVQMYCMYLLEQLSEHFVPFCPALLHYSIVNRCQ